MSAELLATARDWADADPHAGDRAEIEALIEAENVEQLARHFAGPLTFGTAGLRGPLRAGPSGMNAAVVHLAGIAGESTWPAIAHTNIDGTYCALEAARRSGVSRVVLASSNHATGYTPRPDGGLLREEDAPPRPDTYYGVAKVTMEALGSLYVDRYGLDVVCLRIGSAFPEPTTTRQLATWLSPGDTVSLVDAALTAPSPGFSVVWGVSDNTRRWWDLSAARALGYEPADDAEVYAEALVEVHGEPDLGDPVHARVGGEYTRPEFDAENFEKP